MSGLITVEGRAKRERGIRDEGVGQNTTVRGETRSQSGCLVKAKMLTNARCARPGGLPDAKKGKENRLGNIGEGPLQRKGKESDHQQQGKERYLSIPSGRPAAIGTGASYIRTKEMCETRKRG